MTVHGVEGYPLYWPDGWTRTPSHKRQRSRYEVAFGKARDDVLRSLKLMGARDVVISSGIPLRRDGFPYAGWREPDDPGVAVYWTQKREPRVMACDYWRTVRENLRAIGLSLEGLRAIERAGASQILERAFLGFAALPASTTGRHWRQVLGLDGDRPMTNVDIERAFRAKAATAHPDAGGNNEAFHELTAAREQALREIAG